MAKRPKISKEDPINGVMIIRLQNWKYFYRFVTQELVNFPGYCFRGQSNSEWKLENTLDRLRKKSQVLIPEDRHLDAFKYAARGRRNGSLNELSENDWWSLGQHYGLATPLLDFTRSPYVALYFAFSEESDADYRAVYAIHMSTLLDLKKQSEETEEQFVDIFTPLTEENHRLINQAGLFVRLPPETILDEWVQKKFSGDRSKEAVLIKMLIPNRMVEECLIHLNRSNINHLTLFPDLMGASEHANMQSAINKYDTLGLI
ncbi:FRG domain-containing protein [Marinobacter sp. VGCF2001]|uniref:FRG domain-containing protein n=1 Tax=Marinobacter sp. VGCF2001 TaxID=3417189 RepID=UPI003CF5F870